MFLNKRKIPVAFFVFGVIQHLIRYFVVAVIGLICLLTGGLTSSRVTQFGLSMLLFWIIISVVEETKICHTIKKDQSRSDLNGFYDTLSEKAG